ncbi:MAG TPA: hypothetical protein VKO42_04820 [Patescibacteria group bacterium]|nr:hypothetical protein [Patescibacteria group bacterium]
MIDLSKVYHYFYTGKEKAAQVLGDVFDFFSVKVYSLIALFFDLLGWIMVFFIMSKNKEGAIVLHYSVDFGVDLIGDASQLIVVPVLGLIILISNLILLLILNQHKSFKFLSHLLLAVAMAVNVFLTLSLVPIYLLNFS